MNDVLHISCNNSCAEFIRIFNSLKEFLKELDIKEIKGLNYSIFRCEETRKKNLINIIKSGKLISSEFIPSRFSKKPTIIIDIMIPDDDSNIDNLDYRYLVMISNVLLDENDIVLITCSYVYYNKIGSFFILENIKNRNKYYSYTGKTTETPKAVSLPMNVSISNEWFPVLSLNKNTNILNLINSPLHIGNNFSLSQVLNSVNTYSREVKGIIDFNRIVSANYNHKKERMYSIVMIVFISKWLQRFRDTKEFKEIEEWLLNESALTVLLFSIQLNKLFPSPSNVIDIKAAKKLLLLCSDYSEGLFQLIENLYNYSNGGVFTLRVNDNLEKIASTFELTNNSNDSLIHYIRMSLIDYSNLGIRDSINKKLQYLNSPSLKEIFIVNSKDDDELNSEYFRFITSKNNIIHHYGLPIFCSTVTQYYGCFLVKSSSNALLKNEDLFASSSSFNTENKIPRFEYIGKDIINTKIPGTEYDIILPITKESLSNQPSEVPTSLSLNTVLDDAYNENDIVFDEVINFFNSDLNVVIAEQKKTSNNQQRKENIINIAGEQLSKSFIANKKIYYFYFEQKGRIAQYSYCEIIPKIIMKAISLIDDAKKTSIVLYGLTKFGMLKFSRQFALFYRDRSGNDSMKGKQIYLVSRDYNNEVLFAGYNLREVLYHQEISSITTGIYSEFVDVLKHITNRDKSPIEHLELPIAFEYLPRIEIGENSEPLLSRNEKWYSEKLNRVLENDIHDQYLGCKLENTHVRSNGVHLDTFYEAQLLFVNAYWCNIFAQYLYEDILLTVSDSISKPILIIGYESYCEQLLFSLYHKLLNKGYNNVTFAVFENERYISPEEKTPQRLRYIENFFEKNSIYDLKDAEIVFICGITTTLSTMKNCLYLSLLKYVENEYKGFNIPEILGHGYVIVQVGSTNDTKKLMKEYIDINTSEKTVVSKKGYLNFLKDEKCKYLIMVKSGWLDPHNCIKCKPTNFKEEKYLVETNESSTVPMLLIKPNNDNSYKLILKNTYKYTKEFLSDIENEKYLYYSHIKRGSNHFQFYIRTANLVYDQINNKNQLEKWLADINKSESNGKALNVIVSPRHFSNETFVAAVNKWAFNNTAHIINFDVKKEFRASFETKFANYSKIIELLSSASESTNVNFYFVDDHLVTGSTFMRAHSLVKGLIRDYSMKNIKTPTINVFKAIIVLVNRNSNASLYNFFEYNTDNHVVFEQNNKNEFIIPFYSFIDLKTPSIRSYGDSCPICRISEKIKKLSQESSLTIMENHWNEKYSYYKLKVLSEAKQDKKEQNESNENDKFYASRGFRLLQCSEDIWSCIPNIHKSDNSIKSIIENNMYMRISNDYSIEETIEYIISYLKVLSRPHIIYQEGVNNAALQILLNIYNLFYCGNLKTVESEYSNKKLYFFIYNILEESPSTLKYDLFKIVIARLCSLSTNLFFSNNELERCYIKGTELNTLDSNDYSDSFGAYLCIQIKNMFHSTKDCDVRVDEMRTIVEQMIEELIKEQKSES